MILISLFSLAMIAGIPWLMDNCTLRSPRGPPPNGI